VKEMLPDFPKLRHELNGYLMLRIHALIREIEPVVAEIGGVTQHEGDTMAYDQVMGDGVRTVTEGFREGRTEISTRFEDVPSLTGDKLDAKLRGIAEDMARQQADALRQTIETATREAGNAVDAGGAPISKELYLQTMERIEMNFDPKTGRPELVFWGHPKMAEVMQRSWQEWSQDRNFMRAYKDLLTRKHEDWRDRESRRKLVD
jgi:hypothetical protein